MAFVYGMPQYNERNKLWDLLESISRRLQAPWILLGNFSAYLNLLEKLRGRQPNQASMRRFVEFVNKCNLMDIGFQGPKFTWKIGMI